VILLLIQVGGMGVVTMAVAIFMFSGRKIGLKQRWVMQESISAPQVGGIVRMTGFILKTAFLIEAIGALLLALRFCPQFGLGKGIWYGIFHAVSAFCNAGFDLMGPVSGSFSSLECFVGDPLINLTVMTLILVAGLGFPVWQDLAQNRLCWKKLRLHTRAVLALTAFLVLVPAALFFITERNATMAGMTTGTRVWASLFSAVTPRTAGFDTVPTGELSPAGGMLTLLLMLTGGNSGSTAGGAKTTTLLLVVLTAVSILRGEEDVHIFGRRIENDLLRRACSIVVVYLTLGAMATLAICAMQPEFTLQQVLIEVFSAIDTVGLTAGITRQLNTASRVLLILLMYAGRLGSMTFMILLTRRKPPAPVQYPTDKILVG
jgi:trk system potassium uptake protein TrkH